MKPRRFFVAILAALAVCAGFSAPAFATGSTPSGGTPALSGPSSVSAGSTATFTVSFVPTDGCTSAMFSLEQTGGSYVGFGGTITAFGTDASGNSTASATTGPLGVSGQTISYTVKVVLAGCTGSTGTGLKETVTAPVTAGGVTILSTTTTVSATPTSVVAGPSASVSVSATVSNGTGTPPTGTVSFSINGTPYGSGPVTLDSNGTATLSNLGGWGQAGPVTITANYSGDSTDSSSQGSATVAVTAPAMSNTTVTVSASPTSFLADSGISPTLTAVVARVGGGGVPTGSVNFFVNSTGIGTAPLDATGTATLTTSSWTAGNYAVTASYGGDSSDNPATGVDPVAVSVGPAPAHLSTTTALSVSPATNITAGDFVTMTATVAPVTSGGPALTGAVAFFANGLIIADAPIVGGTATLVQGSWVQGTYKLSAEYLGDSNYLVSWSADINAAVNAIPSAVTTQTAVSVSPDPIVAGQPATLAAVVSQQGIATTPVGDQVVFYANRVDPNGVIEPQALIGEAPVQTVNGQNVAILTTAGWTEGNYVLSVSYLGDIANDPSNGSVQVSATGASTINLLSSASSSTYGNPVTFQAQVAAVPPATDSPTGSVTFTALAAGSATPTTLCTALTLVAGGASCTSSSLAPGTYTVTAAYSGDSNFPTASATTNQVVNPIPVTVTVTGSLGYGSTSPVFGYTTSQPLPAGTNLAPSCSTVNGAPIVSTPPLAVGGYTLDSSSCSGAAAPTGYALTYVGGALTVNTTAVTATVSATMVYGSGSPVFTYTTVPSLVTGATLTPSCTTVNNDMPITPTLDVSGTYTIDGSSCTGPTLAGYTITYSGGPLTVIPAPVVVTVSGTTVTGSNSVTLTYSATPSVALAGTLTCATVDGGTPINLAGVGTHTIVGASCSGLSAANYSVSYLGATAGFVVTAPASCVVIFTTGPDVTTITGTYRGNYEVENGATLYLNGGTITGNVKVDPTGSFLARGGTVGGNVQSDGGPVSLQGTFVDGNVQTHGGALALGAGTYVDGNVQVTGGTTLCSLGNSQQGAVRIDGNLQASDIGPTLNQVAICDTATKGDLQYQDNAAPAIFGGSASCTGNAIGGNLQVKANSALLTIGGFGYGNTAAGNIQVMNNTGSGTLTANSAGGNCQLQNNVPGILGTGNSARGQNTGNRTA